MILGFVAYSSGNGPEKNQSRYFAIFSIGHFLTAFTTALLDFLDRTLDV
jgi:hypothetical protein